MTAVAGRRGARVLTTARVALTAAALLAAASAAGCGTGLAPDPGRIAAVGAENEYANVISQIGGQYVSVTAIMSNPNTDPHTFEASQQVAQRGERRAAGGPERGRLRHLHEHHRGGLPQLVAQGDRRAGSARPAGQHPEPASLVRANDHARGRQGDRQGPGHPGPAHAAYFNAQVATFDSSLDTWTGDIAALKASYAGPGLRSPSRCPTTCSRPQGWTTSPPGPSRRTS